MWQPAVILMLVVFIGFGISLAVAAVMERRRNQRVISHEPQRARRRRASRRVD